MDQRKMLRLHLVCLTFSILLVDAAQGWAQTAEFTGPRKCSQCHENGPSQLIQRAGEEPFVTQTEALQWLDKDKHSRAFELIDFSNKAEDQLQPSHVLSQQICVRLGIADIHTARQCLSCHANWVAGDQPPPFYTVGVTCESCHGPSSLWEPEHDKPDWRQKDPEEKWNDYHFVNVRDPVQRARQCYSCHIGNTEQGKIITHDMYAAGHPPLPGIEIETFVREMPVHWKYLSEKGDFAHREDYVRANFPYLEGKSSSESYRTRSVVMGGITALRQTVELFTEQAANQDDGQPELAVFDCFACHHDLKTPAWRQQRGFAGVPGRPRMREWPIVMVKLGIFHAATDQASFDEDRFKQLFGNFSKRMSNLQHALDVRPFGNPQDIRANGTNLIEGLDELVELLREKSYDRSEAIHLMKFLCVEAKEVLPDYDSARQIAWALHSIFHSITVDGQPQELTRQDQIRAALERFGDHVQLSLPARHENQITEQLPAALQKLADYDPNAFQERIEELDELLPPLPFAATPENSSRTGDET